MSKDSISNLINSHLQKLNTNNYYNYAKTWEVYLKNDEDFSLIIYIKKDNFVFGSVDVANDRTGKINSKYFKRNIKEDTEKGKYFLLDKNKYYLHHFNF